jgi:Zn-dependent M28 family amino/carboxypeptidase
MKSNNFDSAHSHHLNDPLSRHLIKNTYKTIIIVLLSLLISCNPSKFNKFNGERAYNDVAYQVSLGPRYPNSVAHSQTSEWIIESLIEAGWVVELQTSRTSDINIKNILAHRGTRGPWIILGAHYDTRLLADSDSDPQKRSTPVLGANDGASGVGILLELARVLPDDLDKIIWLVFFDAEDNGGIAGWDWAMGSQFFVEHLEGKPDAVVIIDMVGDSDLNIYIERSSHQELVEELWGVAETLGYHEFIKQPKYHVLDDHTAFILESIPAIVIIDLDYPYWHTTSDTLENVSSSSLQVVGDTILTWMTIE